MSTSKTQDEGNSSEDDSSDEDKPGPKTRQATIDQMLCLRDIDFKVKHGEFIAVVGDVGSGKTSLLSAIIG
jgi:ABC-type polysaccharide/polyol phosphate transport system ATPase subunit